MQSIGWPIQIVHNKPGKMLLINGFHLFTQQLGFICGLNMPQNALIMFMSKCFPGGGGMVRTEGDAPCPHPTWRVGSNEPMDVLPYKTWIHPYYLFKIHATLGLYIYPSCREHNIWLRNLLSC